MANISNAQGTVKVYTIKKGDKKAVKWLIEAVNESYSGDYGMEFICDYLEEEEFNESIEFGFYGTGRWCFSKNLESFNEWYIKPLISKNRHRIPTCLKNNLNRLKIKQACKRIQAIEFSYYDCDFGGGFLVDEQFKIFFKDGIVSGFNCNTIDMEFSAANVVKYGFEAEAYDCTPESMKEICESALSTGDAYIFQMLTDQQWIDMSEYLSAEGGTSVYLSVEDFLHDYKEYIHKYEDEWCIINKSIGEEVSKINNTIILLMGESSIKYPKKKEYTAKGIRDFFSIVENAMNSEYKEDVLFFLGELSPKPDCVKKFLALFKKG